MQIGRIHSGKKVIAQVLLLAVPSIALAFYLLWNVNHYYAVLQNEWIKQGFYFAAGIVSALIFYAYRFRFITTVAALLIVYFLIYKLLGSVAYGEFDAFFFSVQFLIFSILFTTGWLAGYGFSRSKYFTVFWSVFVLALQIFVVSKATAITAASIILAFAPVLVYAFFVIYTAELIRNMNEDEHDFAWFVTKRLIGFMVLATMVLTLLFIAFEKEFKTIEKDWGGGQGGKQQQGGKESMTKENKDGTVSNKDNMRVTGSLAKDKRLVFVAKLDNYLEDGVTPNPLYFTSTYFTKYDSLTQTFEEDSKMPSNDLFQPNPSKIPLYFSKVDSQVIKNTQATIKRKVVTADVYKVLLSPNDFIAPSTAFFVQPIPVEKEYKSQFKSAYRAKMWVSDLNSAFFIYNPAGNFMLEDFQQQRFDELRNVTSFAGVDKNFYDYYTFMSSNPDYDRIRELAKQITKNAVTPVDKMIAIRDYFLSKDEFGQPLFKYSDNPGVPGIPSANKLNYFLFENRKGYCAYYAGATLFLLRALGIPSRIAAGFLTVDRSSKNPGWYWFYADQAHAWVQLYFPGYGWIDFDTTIPDLNTQQSPQPDGTPPMNTQKAFLVADGKAVSIDTVAKRVTMKVNKILYHDEDYVADVSKDFLMDVSIAAVTKDTGAARLSDVKAGANIVAVSYAEAFKDLLATPTDDLHSILNMAPKPAPIDEIKIMESEEEKKAKNKKASKAEKPFDWVNALWVTLAVISAFIILLLATPWIVWQLLQSKAGKQNNARTKAYHIYTASMYYLNQLGFERKLESTQQYAMHVDKTFGTNFSAFVNVYQKIKYSNTQLNDMDITTINEFFSPFKQKIKTGVPFKKRLSGFLNIYNTLNFFTKPKST